MPEGVETKLISEELHRQLHGKRIRSIDIIGGRYRKEYVKGQYFYTSASKPLTVESVNCHGKQIWFTLIDAEGNKFYLFNHLGMTGFWNLAGIDAHTVATITLEDLRTIYFSDMRHFASLEFGLEDDLKRKLKELGPNLMDWKEPNHELFARICAKHAKKNITAFLMNQKILAGVGNYIKAESLYRAKISPWRTVGSLTEIERQELLETILLVMQTSYQAQGLSIRDFAHMDGKKGDFQNFLQVYKRSADSLGNPVEPAETPDKRTTWWVPNIQK